MQSYKVHANYKPRTWIILDGAIDIHENRDNVSTVNDLEHGRSYSFVTTLMPDAKLFYDLGYTYTDIYLQADICYYDNAFGPPPTTHLPGQLRLYAASHPGSGGLLQQATFPVWRRHVEGHASESPPAWDIPEPLLGAIRSQSILFKCPDRWLSIIRDPTLRWYSTCIKVSVTG